MSVDAEAPTDILAVGARVGRFAITRLLGSGGMGVVYEARDPELNRSVAVKVLRRGRHDDSMRLLREAQALAKLQHPNVVGIYDVGIADNVLFIAMELVDGENLEHYLETHALDWREKVALYVQAGRGLAAAHDKGIVHRDFKPANVLRDRDGRVRVSDFGLARVEPTESWPPTSQDEGTNQAANQATNDASRAAAAQTATVTSDDASTQGDDGGGAVARGMAVAVTPSGDALASPLTRDGALLGTPWYMAPEQKARQPATARSDQYSFCVGLWAALFGEHPFPDERPTPRRRPGAKVPRWLARALVTGLDRDPAERHPSMAALLDVIERTPHRRQVALGAAAAGFAVAAGGWFVMQQRSTTHAPDPCRDIPRLAAWNDQARTDVRAAFTATGLSFAPAAFESAAARLDDHAGRWHAMRIDNCRATRVVRSQSEALLDARNLCLDRRADEVAALVAALRHVDRDGVGRAADAIGGLGDLSGCADAAAIARGAPLPADPARADAVRASERDIAALSAELDIGRVGDREPRVTAAVARARELAHPPLTVAALQLATKLHVVADKWPEAAAAAQEALLAAEAAGDDEARFRVSTQLVEIAGLRLQKYDESARASQGAEALLKRLGDEPARASRLHCARALDRWADGAYQVALEEIDRCVALRERIEPRDDVSLARAMHLRAIILEALDRNPDALATEERAIAITRAALGDRHPNLARMMNTLAVLYREEDRYAESEATLRQVLAIQEEIDPTSSDLAATLMNLGNVLRKLQRLDEATPAYQRAIGIYEAKLGPTNTAVANALDMLGLNLTQSGKPVEGEAAALRSLAIRQENGSGDHPTQAAALRLLAKQYRFVKQPAKALERYRQALVIVEKKYGKDHPMTVSTTAGIGEALADLGRDAEARAVLEHAKVLAAAPEASGQLARIDFALARAMWSTPSKRAEARRIALEVLASWKAEKDTEYDAEIEAWLAAHPAPPK
ncbi:MAG TPA: serine/threonine-protein kinase [Kofleriaceae bacterium]|nr:serine/threonine-protein kinase [Kofleriaceae bacterium]